MNALVAPIRTTGLGGLPYPVDALAVLEADIDATARSVTGAMAIASEILTARHLQSLEGGLDLRGV